MASEQTRYDPDPYHLHRFIYDAVENLEEIVSSDQIEFIATISSMVYQRYRSLAVYLLPFSLSLSLSLSRVFGGGFYTSECVK